MFFSEVQVSTLLHSKIRHGQVLADTVDDSRLRDLKSVSVTRADGTEPETEHHQVAELVELLQQVLAQTRPPNRAISDETVAEMMGISPSAVWELCKPTSSAYDDKFPKPKRYRTLRRTVWNRNRVQAYLDELLTEEENTSFTWPALPEPRSPGAIGKAGDQDSASAGKTPRTSRRPK